MKSTSYAPDRILKIFRERNKVASLDPLRAVKSTSMRSRDSSIQSRIFTVEVPMNLIGQRKDNSRPMRDQPKKNNLLNSSKHLLSEKPNVAKQTLFGSGSQGATGLSGPKLILLCGTNPVGYPNQTHWVIQAKPNGISVLASKRLQPSKVIRCREKTGLIRILTSLSNDLAFRQ